MLHIERSGAGIDSVFDLIGVSEPHMTDALGWAMAEVPDLLERVVQRVLDDPTAKVDLSRIVVNLQRRVADGRTDIEILQPDDYHIILEAKKGWNIPSETQLQLYERDLLVNRQAKRQRLALLTDATKEYALACGFATSRFQVPLAHVTWAQILHDLRGLRLRSPWQRRLMRDFTRYLGRVAHDGRVDSNMVFVVSLSKGAPTWLGMSYIDVVAQQSRYFHPYGRNGWPKEAPNYLAFRYDSCLQSIHHVESRQICLDLESHLPWVSGNDPHNLGLSYALYVLGPAIRPDHTVRSGKLWDRRVNCAFDALLTCDSIIEAEAITKARIAAAEGGGNGVPTA